MPFGIVNGPSTFSRAIYLALHKFIGDFVTTYIDDITVYSEDTEAHLVHLRQVFKRLRQVQMKLKTTKCDFAKETVDVLGFTVSANGIATQGRLLKKIQDFPIPRNKTDVRAFINLAGFYRRHIQAFGEIAAPLAGLLRKNEVFNWTTLHEKAFNDLKKMLISPAVLKYPDPRQPYVLYTDASDYRLRAILTQKDEHGDERPVCFLSRKIQGAEINYPTVEKELLAVVYALSKLRKYLYESTFVLCTDNTAVRYLFLKSEVSSRLQRWIMAIQEFQFTVKHIPGKTNVVADVLSRYPVNDCEDGVDDPLQDLYPAYLVSEHGDIYEPYLDDILQYVLKGDQTVAPSIKKKALKLRFENERLFRKVGDRFVKIPFKHERAEILRQTHDGHGHFGRDATWARLYQHYWWPNAYVDMKEYLQSCTACQLFADAPIKDKSIRKFPVSSLFERFALDYVGPLPISIRGNQHILVAVEYFTKWPIVKAVAKADQDTTARFLYEEVYAQFGPPTEFLTDNGSHFDNVTFANFCAMVQIKHKFSSPYHPRTNGLAERFNGTLVRALKKLSMDFPRNWDDHIPAMLSHTGQEIILLSVFLHLNCFTGHLQEPMRRICCCN